MYTYFTEEHTHMPTNTHPDTQTYIHQHPADMLPDMHADTTTVAEQPDMQARAQAYMQCVCACTNTIYTAIHTQFNFLYANLNIIFI